MTTIEVDYSVEEEVATVAEQAPSAEKWTNGHSIQLQGPRLPQSPQLCSIGLWRKTSQDRARHGRTQVGSKPQVGNKPQLGNRHLGSQTPGNVVHPQPQPHGTKEKWPQCMRQRSTLRTA
eukprot:5541503-Amphidinium_carterae.2